MRGIEGTLSLVNFYFLVQKYVKVKCKKHYFLDIFYFCESGVLFLENFVSNILKII